MLKFALPKVTKNVFRLMKVLLSLSVTVVCTRLLPYVRFLAAKALSVCSKHTARLSLQLKLNAAVRFVVLSFTIFVNVQVNLHVSKKSLTKITNPCVIVNFERARLLAGFFVSAKKRERSGVGANDSP
ncbi:hypothetical protein ALTERO38_50767 [Alteromonas sp. 38]|nr:hypothetical protein ALTER154_80498 [Alteromonas sp. 154]VXB47531.1 hypothetical protein ALTERO38_50767 [Alteromonas sp. 38]